MGSEVEVIQQKGATVQPAARMRPPVPPKINLPLLPLSDTSSKQGSTGTVIEKTAEKPPIAFTGGTNPNTAPTPTATAGSVVSSAARNNAGMYERLNNYGKTPPIEFSGGTNPNTPAPSIANPSTNSAGQAVVNSAKAFGEKINGTGNTPSPGSNLPFDDNTDYYSEKEKYNEKELRDEFKNRKNSWHNYNIIPPMIDFAEQKNPTNDSFSAMSKKRKKLADDVIKEVKNHMIEQASNYTYAGGLMGAVMEKIAAKSTEQNLNMTQLCYVVSQMDKWINEGDSPSSYSSYKLTEYITCYTFGGAWGESQNKLFLAFNKARLSDELELKLEPTKVQ